MASQYTVLRQYAPYVSPYNVDLIKDVAMYKQGKVDAARQKIYTQMDYLMGQDIAKESDRAYMENKMAVTIADINERFRGVDLSSDGVTRAIQGEISNVLDDTVINAIAGTKEGKRMKQYLSDIQQNHPELYSAANAYVAMKPYTQWLNDGKTGSRLGDLNYVPYTDYNKELGTKMEELRKIHKGTKFTQPLLDKDGNPTGATQEITIDQMSPEQIATMAMGSLSDKAKQQMMVEATYMVDSNPDAYSANAVRMYTDAITNQGQEYVSKLEAELAGAESNPEKKKQLEQEIIRAKANVTSMKMYRDSITDQSYDPYQGAMKVIENNFANNAARMYAYDNSQYILKKDELYWAQMNYNQKEREIAKNDELKRLALEWKINLGKAYFGLKQSEIEANLGYKYDALRQAADFKSADLGLGYEKLKEQQRYNTERIKNLSTGKMGRSGAKSIQMALGSESPFTITRNPVETSSEINIGQMTAAKFQETYTGIGNAAAKLSTALGGETMNKIRSFINKEIQDNGDTSAYKNLSSEEQLLKYIKENGGVGNAFFSQEGINHKQATDSYMELNRWIDAMDVQYDRIKEEIAINNDKKEIYADNIAKKLGGVKNDTAYGLALAKMNQGLYVSGNKAQTVFSKSNAGLLRDVLSKEGLDLDKFIDLNIDGNYQMKDLSLDSINAMTEKERAFYVGMRYNNSHGTSGDMVFGNGMKLSDVYDFDSRAIDNEVTKAINTVRAKYLMEESPNSATIDVVTTEGKTGFEESAALRKIYTTKMPEAPIGKSDTSGGSIMSYTLTPIKSGVTTENGDMPLL